MDSLRATIGSSILAPEITNSTIGKDENEEAKMVDEDTKDGSSDFILYFLFPGLEKLVGRVSKRMQFNFPPCPEKLIPYRDYVDAYFEVRRNLITYCRYTITYLFKTFCNRFHIEDRLFN